MNNNNSLHRQIHYSNHFKVFVNKHLFMPESKSVSYIKAKIIFHLSFQLV